jgi:hypothetical protein
MISSMSSSNIEFCGISPRVGNCGSVIDDRLMAGKGMLIGGIVAGAAGALSSDPGSRRSISRGDCPGKLGPGDRFGGVESSNKLLKLLVT